MTEKEFWEDDPQLYWSYLIFFERKRKIELDNLKGSIWSIGEIDCLSTSIAIANSLSSGGEKIKFPSYEEYYNGRKEDKKTNKEINQYVQAEYNAWARF